MVGLNRVCGVLGLRFRVGLQLGVEGCGIRDERSARTGGHQEWGCGDGRF